jgi:ligand-binding SRPBCC domain-containing protein
MSTRRLHAVQQLPVPLSEAWAFFSDPRNLAAMTPAWLRFEFTSDLPEHMYAGLRMTYRVRPFLGIPVVWVSEITEIDVPHRFVDEQQRGPYRSWRHEHRFRPVTGGVEMEDLVSYALPFGPVGSLAERLFVRRQLTRIFAFRHESLKRLFGVLP